MNASQRRSLVLCLSVFLLPACAWAAEKPIAVVASGNASAGDRKFFQYYVTARLGVVAQDRGEFLDPSEFAKYSLVVWLRGCGREFTPVQIAAMKRYLENGGHVLMTNGAIYNALGRSFKDMPWVGARAWTPPLDQRKTSAFPSPRSGRQVVARRRKPLERRSSNYSESPRSGRQENE